ncbi:SDR family NAD(P)-dependent oxidoreductase [Streptomyces sp. NPDC049954]|uniref:SDR family NAD(P)-dependent oxidoreductase n=1 Tax=Streptomyces sp. NPDC049954 TaxID=3155779 RepID=UPI003443490C
MFSSTLPLPVPAPPLTTPFGFASTAEDVIEGIDLSGRRAVVTGGASGIGVETARVLASAGAEVTLAVRDAEAGRKAAATIGGRLGKDSAGSVRVAPLDLADRASVRAFAESWTGPLHLLVNNAGVMASPETRTAEGWELQFATNHLGHFGLATGLHRALAAAHGARIVSVASNASLLSPVVFDDPHFLFRPYDPWLAYAQSKTANILFAVEASRRWAGDGVFANSLNPGAIATNLQRHVGNRLTTPPERQKSVAQGAATSVLLATSPVLEGLGGRYFEDGEEAPVVHRRPEGFGGVAAYAVSPVNATRLWELSRELLDS